MFSLALLLIFYLSPFVFTGAGRAAGGTSGGRDERRAGAAVEEPRARSRGRGAAGAMSGGRGAAGGTSGGRGSVGEERRARSGGRDKQRARSPGWDRARPATLEEAVRLPRGGRRCGRAAGRGSGGPPPRTGPRDVRGDQHPVWTAAQVCCHGHAPGRGGIAEARRRGRGR